MKVTLAKGEGYVGIKYDTTPAPEHLVEKCPNGLQSTTLTVQLPDGETLTSRVGCYSADQFVKRQGRFYAFMKMIDADNMQAERKALDAYQGEVLKRPETAEGLAQAAKAFYKLSREDRRKIFGITCPEFFRNTPERRAIREKSLFERLLEKVDQKALFERLKTKYAPKRTRKTDNTINITQTMDDVVISSIDMADAAK